MQMQQERTLLRLAKAAFANHSVSTDVLEPRSQAEHLHLLALAVSQPSSDWKSDDDTDLPPALPPSAPSSSSPSAAASERPPPSCHTDAPARKADRASTSRASIARALRERSAARASVRAERTMSQRTYPPSTIQPLTDLADGIISAEAELAAVPVVQVGVGAHAVGPAAAARADACLSRLAGPSVRSLQDGLRAAEVGIAAAEAIIAAAEGVRTRRRARRDSSRQKLRRGDVLFAGYSSGDGLAALPPFKYKISQDISSDQSTPSNPVTVDGVALGPMRAAGCFFPPNKLKSGVAIAMPAWTRAPEQHPQRKSRSTLPQASEAAQPTPLPLLDARLPWRRHTAGGFIGGGGGGGGAQGEVGASLPPIRALASELAPGRRRAPLGGLPLSTVARARSQSVSELQMDGMEALAVGVTASVPPTQPAAQWASALAPRGKRGCAPSNNLPPRFMGGFAAGVRRSARVE